MPLTQKEKSKPEDNDYLQKTFTIGLKLTLYKDLALNETRKQIKAIVQDHVKAGYAVVAMEKMT